MLISSIYFIFGINFLNFTSLIFQILIIFSLNFFDFLCDFADILLCIFILLHFLLCIQVFQCPHFVLEYEIRSFSVILRAAGDSFQFRGSADLRLEVW